MPNRDFRHIRLANNQNKPVTNSRDTQDVPLEQAVQVLQIISSYRTKQSILDDFDYFDQQEEERKRQGDLDDAKGQAVASAPAVPASASASAVPVGGAKTAAAGGVGGARAAATGPGKVLNKQKQ